MNHPYTPREDTFLLLECLEMVPKVDLAAEVGCGPGYVLRQLLARSRESVGIDIDVTALKAGKQHLAEVYGSVHLVNSSILPFRQDSFDMVVSNPPYLPSEETLYDPAVHGGPTGVETSLEIVNQASHTLKSDGILLIVASSLSDVDRLLTQAIQTGFKQWEKAPYFKTFFEIVYCFIFSLNRQ
ncbi:MAG: methyltransferase [Candidatus Caldarchaeum sp.]